MKIKAEEDDTVMSNSEMSSLDKEEARLRDLIVKTPNDAFAMAALGRFLRFKRGDIIQGNEWQRKAVDAVARNLSSNLDPTIRYS
jgi:hypothetical protein